MASAQAALTNARRTLHDGNGSSTPPAPKIWRGSLVRNRRARRRWGLRLARCWRLVAAEALDLPPEIQGLVVHGQWVAERRLADTGSISGTARLLQSPPMLYGCSARYNHRPKGVLMEVSALAFIAGWWC